MTKVHRGNFVGKATVPFVTDINGRTVKTVSGNVSQINVSDLNAGVYFMNIETNEGTAVKKIVKN